MRIALLADIHSNLHALEAVLNDTVAADADQLICLGDTVGYGAQPRECVEVLRRLDCPSVLGNHDHYTVSPAIDPVLRNRDVDKNPVWAGIRHAREQLTAEDLAWIGQLPNLSTIEGATVAHASLHEIDQWHYLRSPEEAGPTLRLLNNGRVGFFGHTHRQKIFQLPETPAPQEIAPQLFHLPPGSCYAITVGSVGQSRDPGPEAGWTLWDSTARTVEFRRVPYDCESAARAILAAGLPPGSALRLLG